MSDSKPNVANLESTKSADGQRALWRARPAPPNRVSAPPLSFSKKTKRAKKTLIREDALPIWTNNKVGRQTRFAHSGDYAGDFAIQTSSKSFYLSKYLSNRYFEGVNKVKEERRIYKRIGKKDCSLCSETTTRWANKKKEKNKRKQKENKRCNYGTAAQKESFRSSQRSIRTTNWRARYCQQFRYTFRFSSWFYNQYDKCYREFCGMYVSSQ